MQISSPPTFLPIRGGSPFQRFGLALYDSGLCPIPCGGPDGKRPLVRSRGWIKRPTRDAIQKLTTGPRFAEANIGVLTGLSGVTVVDVDDMYDFDRVIDLFGPSPLITSTPRGGRHVWYRANGEPCSNLRKIGIGADLKGQGGFIVVPPSVRDGLSYGLFVGSWDDLPALPPISAQARQVLQQERPLIKREAYVGISDIAEAHPKHFPGSRNDGLFRSLLKMARGCETEGDLIGESLTFNDQACEPPLGFEEVVRTARSAWRLEVEGRNFSGGSGFACSFDLIEALADPNAFWLLAVLRRAHVTKAVGASFAISPRAMAWAGVAKPLKERTIRQARDRLVATGFLHLIRKGGRFKGDPALFSFAKLDRLHAALGTVAQ